MLVIIGIVIIIGIIIVIMSMTGNENKKISDYQNQLLQLGYKLDKGNQVYDLKATKNDKIFLIKFLNIPAYAELQINNHITYEVKYGAGSTPGKMQPYKKYLTNVKDLVKYQCENNEIKLFVIYPKPKKIVKYINECEIIFVDYKTDVWGMHVVSIEDYNIYK